MSKRIWPDWRHPNKWCWSWGKEDSSGLGADVDLSKVSGRYSYTILVLGFQIGTAHDVYYTLHEAKVEAQRIITKLETWAYENY